ncbi:helix-turn-helix domain-containing protein [Enterococcus sp. DIV0212c]|uniref:helix-turn-helix domain-containing protein n=1 Tax=Enterococcus sp. DIV0212c TaxID=2230867 RepID=UPI001A9A7A30|nr:helix-turn-helix domain-containing protein [Enterococcus sp. DIV0212c]MBO1353596.1 helix-turn-helix domain-containing protein [Enterococcus sp. DIV0212c]
MKKNETLRFELLKQLLYAKSGATTQQMMDLFNISSKTFYRYKKQLSDDLNNVFTQNEVTIKKKKLVYIIELAPPMTFSYVLDSMRLYYIKISQKFSILDAILKRHYISVEALAQDLNLSPSHVYSNLTFLNKLLRPFKLEISFSTTIYKTNIQGTEQNIRVLGFVLFWIVFKGLEWPFSKTPSSYQTLPLAVNDERLSPSQQTRLRYFQNVTYWRVLYRKESLSLSKEFMDYLVYFETVSPTRLFSNLEKVDLEQVNQKDEAYFFGFLSRFLIANIDSSEERRKIAQTFIHSKLPLAELTTRILDKLLATYKVKLSTDNYLENYYLLIICLIYIRFVGINFRKFLVDDTVESKAKWFSSDEPSYRLFVKETLLKEPLIRNHMNAGFVSLMAKFFHSILKSGEMNAKLLIFIQHSPNHFIYDFIKNNLLIIFGDATLVFTFDITEADVIISDAYEGEKTNDQTFHLEHSHDQATWRELILFISGKIYALHNA